MGREVSKGNASPYVAGLPGKSQLFCRLGDTDDLNPQPRALPRGWGLGGIPQASPMFTIASLIEKKFSLLAHVLCR